MHWDAVFWWLPTAAVVVTAIFAFAAVMAQPPRPARRYWIAAVLLLGAFAVGVTGWRQTANHAALGEEAGRLREFAAKLDDLGKLLPPAPAGAPGEGAFDTVAAAIRSLNAKIADFETQIEALQQKTRARTIAPDTAARLADYLRRFGPHRVVMSCVPDDIEAYNYANQLANALREAGWEALGPEKTTIFGEAPAMGIRLFVRGGTTAAPETANLLIDAFSRFNIPFESGLGPSDAIPDPQTTELFVSHKP